MPRPKSKEELLALSEQNYQKLMDFVDARWPEEQAEEFKPGTMNRNIRDILAHLHHWHLMMLDWYEVGMRGEKPDMPAKGYTWKTLLGLNHEPSDQPTNIGFVDIPSLYVNKIYSRDLTVHR